MPLQRILDLAWMGQGACQIGKAQIQLATSRFNQAYKNCSVIQSVARSNDQVGISLERIQIM